MAPKITVETVPEYDDDEDDVEDPHNAAGHLGQITQHSQSTETRAASKADEDDDESADNTKMSPVELNGRAMPFDELLDTFLSRKTSNQRAWNAIFASWDDIEEIDDQATAWIHHHKQRTWTALEKNPRKALAPRRRLTASTKKPPTTGAPKSPTTGAEKSPTTGATSGDKRPSSTPQRGTNKATRTTHSSTVHTTPNEEDDTPEDESDDETADAEATTPPPPANPTTNQGHSIITPELIAALRDNPEALQLIISQAMERERTNTSTATHLANLPCSPINSVAATAIKEAHAASGGPTGKGKWNTAKKAHFAAYCGLKPSSQGIQPFWKQLISAASDDKEAVIQELLNKLADEHDCFQSWIPPPHFKEDLRKLVLRPGRTNKDFFRGLSPTAFADRDQNEIQHAIEQRKLHATYTIQLNCSEAERLEAKAPPMPTTPEKLQLYLKRLTTFLLLVFWNRCELAQEGNKLYRHRQLQLPRILGTSDYITRRGNSIFWELSIATDEFFKQMATMTAFDIAAEDEDAQTPRATCTLNINDILTLHGPAAGDLPQRLKPPQHHTQITNHQGQQQTKQQKPNNGRQQRNDGHPPSTNKGDWAAPFQAILGIYPPAERRRFALTALLKKANTDIKWLQDTLGMANGVCCNTVVFGQCPANCGLRHDAIINPTKATIVANRLKSVIPIVAAERNIKLTSTT